jgi:hypothetical protein
VLVLQLAGSNSELSGIAMMMQLRKMANHPALLRYYFTDEQLQDMARRLAADCTYKETNAEYIVEDLSMMSDFQIHQLSSAHKVSYPFNFVLYVLELNACVSFSVDMFRIVPSITISRTSLGHTCTMIYSSQESSIWP